MPTSQELKDAGLKTTLPRLRILSVLESSGDRHYTAEDVYKALLDAGEDIAFATVYRVLTQFENAGLVLRHNFEGGRSVFELDNGEHHDHMVCIKCNTVTEFYDPEIEERQKKVAQKYDFKLEDHSLYLYGMCKSCQDARSE
ncbi:ferric iron uptake transcriptional regulator [Arenicella xantha]|uniref:Ferric uptake regulation protein n=1 Tax=Arenicella xantha TaxID=644221 RepID=A0A395JHZ2_9GAMM|nr:ferric iron uptake transcriptional regulator [Arenicella xantha]RBP49635.1 Fur family ferric uptake transcriptional regulator [Arenicella xantha]